MVDMACFDSYLPRVYVCQDYDLPGHGCAVDTDVCLDDQGSLLVNVNSQLGNRSALPMNQAGHPSRNGRGIPMPISSWRPQLVPPGAEFGLTPCADTAGRSYLWLENCDCFPPVPVWVTEECPGGTVPDGKYGTCRYTQHVKWPPIIRCRFIGDEGPFVVSFSPSNPFDDVVGQAGFLNVYPTIACATTWNVPALATPPGGGVPYAGDARHVFNYMDIDWHNARFLLPSSYFLRGNTEQAEVAARNAIIDWIRDDAQQGIAGVLNFDRMDRQPGNAFIDIWRREFASLEVDDMPLVYSYPNSRLKNAGTPLEAGLYIHSAAITASVVFNRSHPGLYDTEYIEEVRPWVKFLLEVELYVRITNADTGGDTAIYHAPQPYGGTAPTLITFHGGFAGAHQRDLLDPPIDEIMYIDEQGRHAIPPGRLLWQGSMGAHAIDGYDADNLDIWGPIEDTQEIWTHVCHLASRMNQQNGGRGLKVHGSPTTIAVGGGSMFDLPFGGGDAVVPTLPPPTRPVVEKKVHGGSVFLSIPHGPGSGFALACPEYV